MRMGIPSARATFIEFKPTIVVNPHPKDMFDKASGAVSGFINENLRAMGLNVTLLPTDRSGTCDYRTRTCTGMRGHLNTGAADFSMMQLQMTDLDPRFAYPHRYGPQMYESKFTFGSFPIVEEKSTELDVMQTVFAMPDCVWYFEASLFVIAFLLINFNLLSTRGKNLRFKYRFKIIHIWAHILMHPHVSFSRIYRRILMSMCLFWVLWGYAFMMGSAKSDLTVITPPKYIETLEEVAASNQTAFVMGGLTLALHFDVTGDLIKRKINRRMRRIYRKDIPDRKTLLSEQLYILTRKYRGIAFFDSEYSSGVAVALACRESNYENTAGFQISSPFMSQALFIGMSFNISQVVEDRVKRAHMAQFESAYMNFFLSPSRVAVSSVTRNQSKTIACLESVWQRKSHKPMKTESLSVRAFGSIWKYVSYYAIAAAFALVMEKFWYRWKKLH